MAIRPQVVKVLGFRLHLAVSRELCLLIWGVVSLVQLGATGSPAQTNGPVIQFPSPVYNFGTALVGDPVEHVFEFTNAGDRVLELQGVYPSCSCTIPGDWTKKVAPGHTGRVTLLLDTSRFDGPIAESTSIVSNDRAHFHVALRFKGTVRKPIDCAPRTAVLRPALNTNTGDRKVIRIVSYVPEAITLQQPVIDNPLFTAELKTIDPGREFQLVITTPPARGSAMKQGAISIKTSSARAPLLTIPVLLMPQNPQSSSRPLEATNSSPAVSRTAAPSLAPVQK